MYKISVNFVVKKKLVLYKTDSRTKFEGLESYIVTKLINECAERKTHHFLGDQSIPVTGEETIHTLTL